MQFTVPAKQGEQRLLKCTKAGPPTNREKVVQ